MPYSNLLKAQTRPRLGKQVETRREKQEQYLWLCVGKGIYLRAHVYTSAKKSVILFQIQFQILTIFNISSCDMQSTGNLHQKSSDDKRNNQWAPQVLFLLLRADRGQCILVKNLAAPKAWRVTPTKKTEAKQKFHRWALEPAISAPPPRTCGTLDTLLNLSKLQFSYL